MLQRTTRQDDGYGLCSDGKRPTSDLVAVKLSRSSYEFAQSLVKEGHIVLDDRDAWSEHRPTAPQENEYIESHGMREYGRWHLGVDDSSPPTAKGRYKFPYGDFDAVHRCAVISAESRAAQNDYDDIHSAAAHLHGMLEAKR
jgi:hypothetical protein